MAVSVRAACSMPRLHSLDFDLPPKNQFDVRARWGNSSPVLILSLLEIVEQDSIHVKEAAPRLQPGWVRNACAAFEKGVAFSDYGSHQNVQNSINCQINDVQHLSTKSPNQKNEGKTRLPKAKSWESLDSCRKKSPKKAKVPLPKVRPKICVACKRSLAQQEDKFKTHKDCQASLSTGLSDELPLSEKDELLLTDKLPKATPLEENSGIAETRPTSDRDVGLNAQNNDLPPPHKTFNRQCSNEAITVAKSELGNKVTPSISNSAECQDNNTHALPLERGLSIESSVVTPQPVGDVHGVLVVQNVSGEKLAPSDAIEQLSQQQEQEQSNAARQNDSLSQGQTIAATSNDSLNQSQTDATRPNDSLHQNQMNVELQKEVKPSLHLTANLHGANETQPSNSSDTPSVRPKLRVFSQSSVSSLEGTDTDNGQNTTVKNCLVHHGYAKVAVSIKSFSVPVSDRSEVGNADREREYECAETQCAIGESATEIYSRGVSNKSHESDSCSAQEGHNLTLSHGKQSGAGHCETPNVAVKFSSESPGLTITLGNMHHYPPDRLETFLLIKETYKNSFPISWENFVTHFNSSRQMVIPRKRFCAKFEVYFENEKDQSDNMKSFKKALAKKWSRSDDRLEERKERLSCLKLGSLRFQLLCHPLVSYDISELEECESDCEVEEILESVTPFSHVPTYVIARIFRLLKTKDLAALKCTCKDFHWLINQFDITGTDSKWMTGKEYHLDPCMHCGKIQDPRGDVSLCQRHTKAFYKYSVINRQYWTCCNSVKETAEGCEIGLHNNRWTTSEFQPNFICKPWKSQSWYVTANTERWCDKEHL